MSDYIKREDVLSILNEARKEWKPEIGVGRGEYLRIRYKNLPAADVRPVVRCADCRHRDPEDYKCDCGGMERVGCIFPVDDDYFCAYGEV